MSRMEPCLGLLIDTAPVSEAIFERDIRYLHASIGWHSDYGLGTRDLRDLSHYDVFPEIPDRWKEIHQRALPIDRCNEPRSTPRDASQSLPQRLILSALSFSDYAPSSSRAHGRHPHPGGAFRTEVRDANG